METSRTKSFALNSLFSVLNQVIVMLSGFIIPRFMLSYYGSEINGLVSSITQFINYFTIVEAGLSGAAIFSLYKPLAEKNYEKINGIVTAAKKYYYQAGYIFTLAVIVLAVIYPFFVHTNDLKTGAMRFLIIMLGAKGFLDFFSLAKYRTLLTADQKIYVIAISSSIYTILNTVLITLFAINRLPITAVYFFSLVPLLVRTIILALYVRKNYKYIDYKATSDKTALTARWDALFQQFVGMAQNSVPPIVVTIFLTLKDVSIYSIYNMVIGGINGVLTIFTTSLSASFGNIIAQNQNEVLKKTYHEFEYIYLQLIGVVYSVAYIMILPFINLYTRGVIDTNYILPTIATLMVLNGFLYSLKTPQGMIIIAAGHYKETRWRSLFQAVILIVVSVSLAKPLGLTGVIIGSISSNLFRAIDMFFYVPKKITGLHFKYTLKNYLLLLGTVFFTYITTVNFSQNIDSWGKWILYALITTIIGTVFFVINGLIFNRKIMNSIFRRVLTFIRL
jgi:O-antigen/teichoic acid export membrane protein